MVNQPLVLGSVAVGGSRLLPPGGAALVARVVRELLMAGHPVLTGCAVGADAAAVAAAGAAHAPRLTVFAAHGPVSPSWRAPNGRYCAPGSWSGSALSGIASHCLAGGPVVWWAGGGHAVPLVARLSRRTVAMVGEASRVVTFWGSPSSRGTLLGARTASLRGLPVFAFPLGFAGAALPPLGPGRWRPVGRAGVWASAWAWDPARGLGL